MNPLGVSGAPRLSSAKVEIEAFREQARQVVGDSPDKVELGALWLWERSLASAVPATQAGQAVVVPVAGEMTGYLTALAACLGNSSGGLAPAIFEAAKCWDPKLLISPKSEDDPSSYFNANLKESDLLRLGQQLEGGPRYCSGVACSGTWNDGERTALSKALDKLKKIAPHLYPKLEGVVIQTFVGSHSPILPNSGFGGLVQVNTANVLELRREKLFDPGQLEHVLYHEFGHVVDIVGNDFQSHGQELFRRNGEKRDCVSAYATTSAHEDFAETFSFCIKNYDKMTQHPDIYFYGLNKLSDKFRTVFEKSLEQEIPPPSPAWLQLQTNLQAGATPFGFVNKNGDVEKAVPEMRTVLYDMAQGWNLDKPDENLTTAPPGRARDLAAYLSHVLLSGKEPEASMTCPTLEELSGQVAECGASSQPDQPSQLENDLRYKFEVCGGRLERELASHLSGVGRDDLLPVMRRLLPQESAFS